MTDSDAKEWVTVKLPKEVRDDARDDPRTYGEIMRAGLGAPNPETDANINRDLLAEQVVDTLSAETVGGTDPGAIADAVAARGLSLDAAEHRAIAEEVVGMLR